jgi:pilus assembly protein TadC
MSAWWVGAVGALAAALLVAPGPVTAVRRVSPLVRRPLDRVPSDRLPLIAALASGLAVAVALPGVTGLLLGPVVGLGVGAGLPRWRARRRREAPDPLTEAGAWDQLAACLRAGLPLDRAARAVVPVLPESAGAALTRVADLVALGADPVDAWRPALDEPVTARLARAARRSARSGSAVADVAAALADDVRAEAADAVAARAERAGVLVTGPLGLCFLPAFLALGIVPVVVGLAGPLLEQR